MKSNPHSDILSDPAVSRLSEYLLILEQYISEGEESISSRELADVYGNNPNQVRQDVFQLKGSGRVGQGYSTIELAKAIRQALGLGKEKKKLCIIGAGNLGHALAAHVPFQDYGMQLSAVFDIQSDVLGQRINEIEVVHMDSMPKMIAEQEIAIAALCVPATVAQAAADELVKAGIKGILNYSRTRLKTPKEITVKNQQVICSFMQLSYAVSEH